MLLYIATPYRSHPDGHEAAFNASITFCNRLIDFGILDIYCPISHTHLIAAQNKDISPDSDFWLARQIPFLDACNGLIIGMIKGWKQSRGIEFEQNRIKNIKPIWFLSEHFREIPEELLEFYNK